MVFESILWIYTDKKQKKKDFGKVTNGGRHHDEFCDQSETDIKNIHTVCCTALCLSPRPWVRQKSALFQDLLSHLILISVRGLTSQQSGLTLPCPADHHQSESAGTNIWEGNGSMHALVSLFCVFPPFSERGWYSKHVCPNSSQPHEHEHIHINTHISQYEALGKTLHMESV